MSIKQLSEDKSKENAGLVGEEIDAMGQENESLAVKWVQEVEKNRQQEEDKMFTNHQEKLDKKRKFTKNPYYQSLLDLATQEVSQYDIPPGYNTDIILKEDKLLFGLQKVGFRWYAKGMTICGEPKYDINCVQRMVVQMMLSLDELEEQHEKHRTKSGIQLPSKGRLDI